MLLFANIHFRMKAGRRKGSKNRPHSPLMSDEERRIFEKDRRRKTNEACRFSRQRKEEKQQEIKNEVARDQNKKDFFARTNSKVNCT